MEFMLQLNSLKQGEEKFLILKLMMKCLHSSLRLDHLCDLKSPNLIFL